MSGDPWLSASVERTLELHVHGGAIDYGYTE